MGRHYKTKPIFFFVFMKTTSLVVGDIMTAVYKVDGRNDPSFQISLPF